MGKVSDGMGAHISELGFFFLLRMAVESLSISFFSAPEGSLYSVRDAQDALGDGKKTYLSKRTLGLCSGCSGMMSSWSYGIWMVDDR